MSGDTPAAEAELEAFRNEWRAEVTARTRQPSRRHAGPSADQKKDKKSAQVASTTRDSEGLRVYDVVEESQAKSYHDLPDNEEQLRLSNAGQDHDRHTTKEPSSALEHYEHAVEKENQGQLGDSLKHYRRAFKLDDNVHELYKKKHFPAQPKSQKVAGTSLPSTSGQSIQKADSALPGTVQDTVKSFATSRIEAPPPPTDASPTQRSPLGELPQEILVQILTRAAVTDVSSLARIAVTCKHLAYLVMTEESIWKAVSLRSRFGFTDMIYRYACDVDGNPLRVHREAGFSLDDFEDEYDEATLFAQSKTEEYALSSRRLAQKLLSEQFADSWRQMYRSRPRIRFNGCYISTVNYTRPGGGNTNSLSWGVPVHIVTYYRYLRFFRDGTAISLLTTAEPIDVVHHLIKDNLHHHHGTVLPSAVMRDALRGRWRLTGPNSGLQDPVTQDFENEGEVLVETHGSTNKYTFEMRLAFSSAGRGARNNKLAWKSFKSRNRLTDDEAPFTLKHDRGFYWSRVRSFT